jgi:OmpA-OmpF porin, OOP family
MRILITGFVVFVIWCFVSAWLYNDKLLPVINKPVTIPATIDNQSHVADSLMRLKAMMPKDLTIFFEFDDAKFKPDPQADIRIPEFKAWLDKYPVAVLSVRGYTDIVGTPEFNQDLGMERAEVVGKYLEEKGIPSSRIQKESIGESKASENYITEEGRARNRKAEISVKM